MPSIGGMSRSLQILFFLLAAENLAAHPALYHYLEINLLKPGEVSFFVTVHAPELTDTVEPLEADVFGKTWLATRDDATIGELVKSADHFANEAFVFRFGERLAQPQFAFPAPEMIRYPGPESTIPDGCFGGEATLPYQTDETSLSIDFSSSAQKRLMLIINRPAAFPEVVDLEPGKQYAVALPPVPVAARPHTWLIWWLTVAALALLGMVIRKAVERRQ
jgi:hypothetical protein